MATNEVSIAVGDCWRLDDGDYGYDGDIEVASVAEVNDRPSFTFEANKSFAAASPLILVRFKRLTAIRSWCFSISDQTFQFEHHRPSGHRRSEYRPIGPFGDCIGAERIPAVSGLRCRLHSC